MIYYPKQRWYITPLLNAPFYRKESDIMPAYYDENKTWFCKFYYTPITGTRKPKKKEVLSCRGGKEWERNFLNINRNLGYDIQTPYDNYISEDIAHFACKLRDSTIEGKKNVFKNRILPYFENKPITYNNSKRYSDWQNKQISLNYSAASSTASIIWWQRSRIM